MYEGNVEESQKRRGYGRDSGRREMRDLEKREI